MSLRLAMDAGFGSEAVRIAATGVDEESAVFAAVGAQPATSDPAKTAPRARLRIEERSGCFRVFIFSFLSLAIKIGA